MAEERSQRSSRESGRGGKGRRSEDDDKGLHERLQPYGIGEDGVFPEDVVVPPGQMLELTSRRGASKEKGIVSLHPKSIDDVKRWIGVPDEIARVRACPPECPTAVATVERPSELRNLGQAQLRGLYQLGEAYVHGDSALVAAYKNTLDQLVTDAVIVGVFIRQDLDVYGVLELGPDIKLLWARNVRIWPRGTIRCRGRTKFDCLSIEGMPVREVAPWVVEHVPKIGRLSPLEAEYA